MKGAPGEFYYSPNPNPWLWLGGEILRDCPHEFFGVLLNYSNPDRITNPNLKPNSNPNPSPNPRLDAYDMGPHKLDIRQTLYSSLEPEK